MLETIIETRTCKHCQASFDITDKDMEFYDKVSPIFNGQKYLIPAPTFCPDCRQQRRRSFRNERKLYKKKCDFSGKEIFSIYSPDKVYKVYNQEARRGDSWDAKEYGKDFDPNKSFFQQYSDLFVQVPKISNLVKTSTNCDYNVIMGNCKNCYMCSTTFQSEECMYAYRCVESNTCLDCSNVLKSENSYECFDAYTIYNLHFSESCKDCRDSYFLYDCVGCNYCFLCTGLRNKEYCRANEQLSKEAYEEKLSVLLPLTHSIIQESKNTFQTLKIKQIRKYYTGKETINSSGDYLTNCKECHECFNVSDVEDSKYVRDSCVSVKNCMDVSMIGDIVDLMLEAHASGYNGYKSAFVNLCRTNSELLYCDYCMNCQNCFGCTGLKNQSYCILNKQYTKGEYEILAPQIIEKMIADSEWGEFFPSHVSPFGYNETVAMEYYPLTKEEAISKGFNRSDYEPPFPKVEKILKASELPPTISLVSDDILKRAIECEVTRKPFRIVAKELDFYRKHNLPLPTKHPDIRHAERMALRNPRKLRDRTCVKCGVEIKTSYAPDLPAVAGRPEVVYCEACYNKEIYG